jgi:hypothetical protein
LFVVVAFDGGHVWSGMEKLIKETDQVDWILAVVVVFWDMNQSWRLAVSQDLTFNT